MSDETTLLPCPFCGSNKAYPIIELGKHWVECRECTAESGCYRTEAEAIAAWNTRTHSTLTTERDEWKAKAEAKSAKRAAAVERLRDYAPERGEDPLATCLGLFDCMTYECGVDRSWTVYRDTLIDLLTNDDADC